MTDPTVPSLAAMLNDGTFPADDDKLRGLLHDVVLDILDGDGEHRAESSLCVLSIQPDHQLAHWALELVESPEVVENLFNYYDPLFRLNVEHELDCRKQPHPIYVGPRGDGPSAAQRWACDNCGDSYENDAPAFVVGERAGYSDMPYAICYCVPCISIAASALRSSTASPTGWIA